MKTVNELQVMINALKINFELNEQKEIDKLINPQWRFTFLPDNKIIVECKYVSKYEESVVHSSDRNSEPTWKETRQYDTFSFEFHEDNLELFVEEINYILVQLITLNPES